MNFYDIKDTALPEGGQYYFNILVINLAIQQDLWEQNFSKDTTDFWNLENINGSRPTAVHLYQERRLNDEFWEAECVPHAVIEVLQNGEISWYTMIDFDTGDPWRIDYDEEELC